MAKSYVTSDGTTVKKPGSYVKYEVASNPGGLATTGVLMLVGEADAGPAFGQESDLEANCSFGPDQAAEVVAKYRSGPVVDAFRAAIAAANDPDITGSFSRAVIAKTNTSNRASATLAQSPGTYGVLADVSYGIAGNRTSWQVTSAATETLPTTGSFTYIPPVGIVTYGIRLNGGATLGTTIGANATPTSFVSTIDGLTGVAATGGVDRVLMSAAGGRTVGMTVAGNTVVLTPSAAWSNAPTVGDTLIIPTTAPAVIKDPNNPTAPADDNVGAYVITGYNSTTFAISATKLSDAGRAGAVAGTITPPQPITPGAAVAAASDIQAFSPVTISAEAGSVIQGVGKSLEIAELAGADLLSRTAYVLGTQTPVSWVSKTGAATDLASATETKVTLSVARAQDGISETLSAGGEVVLRVGYAGTTATLTITSTQLTTAVTGGSGTALSLTLADFASVKDLADHINAQTGYSADVVTAALGNLAPTALDQVSAIGIASAWGAKNGRVKSDAYRFFQAVDGSSLVQLGLVTPARAALGLPDTTSAVAFLTGGSKGSTSDSDVSNALLALESIDGNFVIPLFSRDASADKLDALTDASSTYTVAAVHSNVKTHVLAMSTLKKKRNRQGFLSVATDFTTGKNTGANLAGARVSCCIQDCKDAPGGSVKQFLPWMTAVKAAGMQAQGFWRNIEGKVINCSGILSRAGDFNPKSDSQVEDALTAGLLVAERLPEGGYSFISDQTTYGRDDNFVWNSIQAIYAADTVALTMAARTQKAFKGQSPADKATAPVVRSFCEGVLADMLRLKLIAPSDDAPAGWRDLQVRVIGNVIQISVRIKLATAIDFIDIKFQVEPVSQTA